MDVPFPRQLLHDVATSRANRSKHGIDFDRAPMIWMDRNRLAFPTRSDVEPRWVVVGWVAGRLWAAVFTQCEAAIRIILVAGLGQTKRGTVKAEESDKIFDDGLEDITPNVGVSKARRPGRAVSGSTSTSRCGWWISSTRRPSIWASHGRPSSRRGSLIACVPSTTAPDRIGACPSPQ